MKLEEIRRRVQEAGEDPDRPSLEEISQIVKEVRQELWSNRSENPNCFLTRSRLVSIYQSALE